MLPIFISSWSYSVCICISVQVVPSQYVVFCILLMIIFKFGLALRVSLLFYKMIIISCIWWLASSSMYIFGGFNGRMLSDTLKLSPAHCEALDKECLSFSLLHGTKCIFATGEGCLKHTLANLRGYPQKKGANCSLLKHSSLPINLTQVCEKQTNCRSCLHNR